MTHQTPIDPHANLRALLQKETFPLVHTFKVVGKNTDFFKDSVAKWASADPRIAETLTRVTPNLKHCSKSFEFTAESADSIIDAYIRAQKIDDLVLLL